MREEECIYEVNIYETKEDYNQGEPFQLNVFSSLEEAKKQLEEIINFNHYYSGTVVNQETGDELYSFYLAQDLDEETEELGEQE